MFIADALITKEYWEPVFGHLDAQFENGNYTKKRGVPIYMLGFKQYLAYVAAERKNGVMEVYGWVLLEKPKLGWACWEVAQSYVFTAVRGEGWGRLIYDSILRDGIILASGSQQSKTGRRMWKTMIKNPDYHIWAHDFSNLQRHAPVIYDEVSDEIWSSLRLYVPMNISTMQDQKYEDVRLIAVRKK